MRIGRMYLNGFGIYEQQAIDLDRTAPAVMFIGRNEAGKSTLLGFIRSILFGFPTRANMAERYDPVAGGMHGGWITLIDDNGNEIRIERYEKNGSLKLSYPDGSEGGEAALRTLLGGLTPELFRHIFAFSLSELQRLETLQSDEISGFLFSAGTGLGGNAIVQTERKISMQMEGLYKPRGSKQELNVALKQIEEAESEVKKSKQSSGSFNQTQEELDKVQADIVAKESARSDIALKREWLNKARQTRDSWLQLERINADLERLPRVGDMAEDTIARLEQLNNQRDELVDKIDRARSKVAENEDSANGMNFDERLIEQKMLLEHLLQLATLDQKNRQIEMELGKERESLQSAMSRHIRHIDASWSIDQVMKFPISVTHQETIARFARQFASIDVHKSTIDADKERLAARRLRLESEVTEARSLLVRYEEQADTRLAGMTERDMEVYESDIRRDMESIRQDAIEWKNAKRRLDEVIRDQAIVGGLPERSGNDKQTEWTRSISLRILAALLSTGLAAVLWAVSKEPLVGVASLAVLFLVYFVVFFRQEAAPVSNVEPIARELSRKRDEATREVDSLRVRIRSRSDTWLSKLGQTGIANEAAAGFRMEDPDSAVEAINPLFEKIEREFATWRSLERHIAQAREKLQAAELALKDCLQEWNDLLGHEENHAKEMDDLLAQWSDWIGQYGISADYKPDSVKNMIHYAEQALQTNDQILLIEAKLKELHQTRMDFKEKAESVLRQFPDIVSVMEEDLHYPLKRLQEAVHAHERIRDARQQLQTRLSELKEEEQQLADQLARISDKLAQLFEDASVQDEAELRRNFELFRQKRSLVQEKREREVELYAWIREGQENQLRETLAQLDADQLEQQYSELLRLEQELSEELVATIDRRGRLAGELERIQSGNEHATLLQIYQERVAGFEQTASRWMQLALAAGLIRKAKEIYERDKQPGVLQQASKYFASITEGRYTRIISRIGEKSIQVEKPEGDRLDSAFLSRGTAEQLYLAMRFALADEYAKTIQMPILMDDIFVNFDNERLDRTLSVLADVTEHHQALLFTCHDHVAAAVKRAVPGTQFVDLNNLTRKSS